MSRKAVGVGILVLVVAAVGAFAFRGKKGFFGLFGSSDRGSPSDAPDELGLDGKPLDGREGAAGKGSAAEADRAATLAGRRVERRGVGGLRLSVVRAGSGASLEGVSVLVTGTGHGGEEVRVTALSDAKGDVAFARLPAGVGYVLRLTSKGDPAVDRPDVEVKAGRDKDLGKIEIGATAALSGKVVDEAGKPIAGAEVRILTGFESILDVLGNMAELFGTLGREPTPLAKAATADDGRFRFEGLPPGPLVIVAGAAGKRQTVFSFRMTAKGPATGEPTLVLEAGAMIAGVVVDAAGAPIVGAHLALLSTGDNDPSSFFTKRTFTTTDAQGRFRALVEETAKEVRAIVDAAGYPQTFSPALKAGQEDARIVLVGGASVEVKVVDDENRPVEGAQATLMVARGEMNEPESVGGFLAGSTDATGTVTLPSGPGKIQMIFVTHRDFATAVTAVSEGSGMAGKIDGDVPKEVKPDGVTKMLVKLKRSMILRGRILDSGGNPIGGADVRVVGGMGFGGSGATRSGADGAYRLAAGIAADGGGMGSAIVVRASGWTQKQDSMQVDASKAKNGEIEHDVTMLASAIVRGKVLDENGGPLAGAEVRVTSGGGFDMFDMLGGGAPPVVTAEDGTYEIHDVAPADAPTAVAKAAVDGTDAATPFGGVPQGGVWVSVTADDRVSAKSEPFGIAAGATVEAPVVHLSKGATLRGKVREPGGRPAAGASVEVHLDRSAQEFTMDSIRGRGSRPLRADADGAFVARALSKGSAYVIARAPGFAPAKVVFTVGEGDPAPVELTLAQAGELKGRVASPEGAAIAGASVRIDASSDGSGVYVEAVSAVSDATGAFVLKGLPRTLVHVHVSVAGRKPRTVDATVGGEDVDVRLEPRDASSERRREELKKELAEIYQKFAAVKDDAERTALVQRMMELQREQQALDKDGSGTELPPTPQPVDPPK